MWEQQPLTKKFRARPGFPPVEANSCSSSDSNASAVEAPQQRRDLMKKLFGVWHDIQRFALETPTGRNVSILDELISVSPDRQRGVVIAKNCPLVAKAACPPPTVENRGHDRFLQGAIFLTQNGIFNQGILPGLDEDDQSPPDPLLGTEDWHFTLSSA